MLAAACGTFVRFRKGGARLAALCVTLSGLLLLAAGCSKEHASEPKPNETPQSFVSIYPFHDGSTQPPLAATTSLQHLHWWGQDPDGWMVGYLFSFDSRTWYWTAKTDSIFSLRIFGKDTTYTFYVSAVDNSIPGGPVAASDSGPISWTPGQLLSRFGDALDPSPAVVRIPIGNSPPEVRFEMVGDIFGTPLSVPETTFTVVSFQWHGTDLDGDETIAKYSIALNDTSASSWVDLPGLTTFVTLMGRQPAPGQSAVDADIYPNNIPQLSQSPLATSLRNFRLNANNVLYLRAEDVSGARSIPARMPAEAGKTWYVKQPKGDLIIIDDYTPTDLSPQFYSTIFDTLGGGRFNGRFDVWDIKTGSKFPQKGKFVPTFIKPAFIETLKLFKYIFWYAGDEQDFDIAQRALPAFRKAGGKVLFSFNLPQSYTSGASVDQAVRDFSGVVDSLGPSYIPTTSTGFVLPRTQVIPEPGAEGYPLMMRDDINSNPVDGGKVVANLRALNPSIGSVILYRLQADPSKYPGMPVLGVKDSRNTFILIGISLYRFNGGDKNVGAFFFRVFKEFGAY